MAFHQHRKQPPHISKIRVVLTVVICCLVCGLAFLGMLIESKFRTPMALWAEARAVNMATQAVADAIGTVLGARQQVDLMRPLQDGGVVGFSYAWNELLQIKLAVTEALIETFDDAKVSVIRVPLGELMGVSLAGAMGPRVPVRILPVGAVRTDMRFDFQATGINHVLHRIYVEVQVRLRVVAPLLGSEVVVHEQIPISTELIQGQVPATFINWNGSIDDLQRTLQKR